MESKQRFRKSTYNNHVYIIEIAFKSMLSRIPQHLRSILTLHHFAVSICGSSKPDHSILSAAIRHQQKKQQLSLIRGLFKFNNWNLLFACIVESAMSHLFFFHCRILLYLNCYQACQNRFGNDFRL